VNISEKAVIQLAEDCLWAKEHAVEVLQRLNEFFYCWDWISGQVELERLKHVVEIGTYQGGWLLHVSGILPQASYELIDPKKQPKRELVLQRVRTRGPVVVHDMTSDEAVKSVQPNIDVLHIDGLHKDPQPLRDFRNYLPLMNPELGVAIFHDLYLSGVAQAWRVAMRLGVAAEFVGPPNSYKDIGIGVVIIRGDG